ncbi:hypothetical protein [Pseudarthrobacter sp. efr-133-R2A-89]|uniref:hypothetical protein n=1 Tax=Pseudarthrobacter sp. efr-133-R2A-89 TaxID=3040302 RepID=UPI002557BEF5|nr:hypothetical protein [Pseudarthrobacter sp. efr-133-R2A-89]
MSPFTATAPFPNALMWLTSEDAQELVIPDVDGVANIWTSENAWGVAVQPDIDGSVTLTIGPAAPDNTAMTLLHDGVLHSGRRLIEVQTVYLETIAWFRSTTHDVALRIWGDDPGQTEHIHIQCPDIKEIA